MENPNRSRISTHSAREDGDKISVYNYTYIRIFQPTPPARTETHPIFDMYVLLAISTHSAREDGDAISSVLKTFWTNFNPLRPRGRRRALNPQGPNHWLFQPTPPARTETKSMGQTARIMPFQPTPPARTET